MFSKEIREKYLQFFKGKRHAIIPSSPLLPENDPTVLFTTAGMHPLVPYLLGETHAQGNRLANAQKCVRTGDIDEVGDNTHLTFFEMMGNWSLGDYFKKEAIEWSFEFLTGKKWLNIPIEKLAVSVFSGDDDAPKDDESAGLWKSLGIPEHKIAYLPKKNNWWGPAGQTGPCGPDTEMFYWVGKSDLPPQKSDPGNDEKNWVEIWNDVFMEYNKTEEGKYEPLIQKNVDTGMGLERVTAVLQDAKSVYETELFQPIIEKIEALAAIKYQENTTSYRIIADHLRAATFMAGDGVKPSNVDQGYVMRRLMRRAIRHGKNIEIEQDFTAIIAKKIIHMMSEIYPELNHEEEILKTFHDEEEQFRKTLNHGLKEVEKLLIGFQIALEKTGKKITEISGKQAFRLYDTYGFPLEMTLEEAQKNGLTVDEKGFKKAFAEHQDLSRMGAEQKFAGGLQDHSEATTRLHTATHLLHAALRKVLGDHVAQKGSNITAERLRFDFSHPDKMTQEQIKEVEQFVNDAIAADVKVECETSTVDEAKKKRAIGLFEGKYGEKVKVYTIPGWSKEICGGPHVEHTGELGHFRIKKEESSSAGIRRIKAILG
ncbi:alanine--tRNA ligase [Candidatus Peregrinibacteria bacterium CG_4_10_14_0_2_um_filter_43_11]|nr:MAG: alanine--tRNA ligase [Candidatus Peregrinibacteria bacterium CG_4_10_14_0_2_um_filter_43_11]